MAKGKLLVGLDIGTSAVKLCQLKEAKKGYQLKAFDIVQLPTEAIVDGVIMSQGAVSDAIRSLMGRNRIRQKECAISVSGYSVIVKRITLPLMTDSELEKNLQWEVQQHIPFDINDVHISHEVLTRSPQMGTMDVLLVAAKREMVSEYMAVVKDSGLVPKVVDVDCFALQNMYEAAYGTADGETIAIVDLGAAITSIIIVSDGVTAFTRDISMGGQQITSEIQKNLDVTLEVAESYKVGGREGETDTVIPQEVTSVVNGVADTIGGEIQRSLSFFLETSSINSIHRILLTGGTSKIPTLGNVLAEQTGLPVENANPFSSLQYDPKTYNPDYLSDVAPQAAVAVGLGLRRSRER